VAGDAALEERAVIPAPFEYLRPASVAEAIDLLRTHGDDARLLAGGHSLIPLMKLRLATPRYLVDIARIRDLSYIREDGDAICIGALTTHAEIEHSDLLKARLPLLPEAAAHIGDAQVRNRGTIGGSLAHAHPAADYPAVMLALEAEMLLQGLDARRTVRAADFFVGMFTTALRADEVLVEIRIPPLAQRTGTAYLKAEDKASHFAVVGIAAVIGLDAGGTCRVARIGVTGLSATPFRAEAMEGALVSTRLDQQTAETAARHVVERVELLSDLFASSDYRAHLAEVYATRAVLQAAGRAHSGN
jgi:carbon-monoxide dehydrogenase medium subunit